MVGDFLAALQVFDGDIVSTLLMVPVGADDLVPDLDIFVEGVFPGEVIEVLENLPAAGIDSGPVELWLKGPGVVVRGNIASTAIPRRNIFSKLACCFCSRDHRIKMPTTLPRIPILPPRPRHLWILLINCQAEIRKASLQFICEQ